MPYISSRNIITHCFHVYNKDGDTCIGYASIIDTHMMVQIGVIVDFKRNLLGWNGAYFPMKNYIVRILCQVNPILSRARCERWQ